jgi:hypothetical protein
MRAIVVLEILFKSYGWIADQSQKNVEIDVALSIIELFKWFTTQI